MDSWDSQQDDRWSDISQRLIRFNFLAMIEWPIYLISVLVGSFALALGYLEDAVGVEFWLAIGLSLGGFALGIWLHIWLDQEEWEINRAISNIRDSEEK